MIILIRHAQSEGNKNRDIHQTVPDHRVKLTAEGHRQAREAGANLRGLLRPDDNIHFFTSPYRRTRETTEGILQSLTSDSPSPSPFPRNTIKVYEEPRLREQDFGNFQPCSAEMERMWMERADYGHFFYRIPNGESAADAYDRVSGFNESLWRLFGEDDCASVCVLVTHGLMTRVFLMKWYHWSVEYFEDLRNINHCEFVIMKLNQDNGKYALQNQLRTWSELRKEKEAERQQERATKGLGPALSVPSTDAPTPFRRKWGGCPEGCNHGIRRKPSTRTSRPNGTDQLRPSDTSHKQAHDASHGQAQPESHHHHNRTHHHHHHNSAHHRPSKAEMATATQQMLTAPEPALGDQSSESKPIHRTIPSPTPRHEFLNPPGDSTKPSRPTETSTANDGRRDCSCASPSHSRTFSSPTASPSPTLRRPNLAGFNRDSDDHLLHSPRSNYALLHLAGRDGGGSMSGANSLCPSEDERDSRSPFRRDNRSSNHQPKPSQDFGNDGDDEGSGHAQRLRRTRSHHSRNNPHINGPGRRNLAQKVANMLNERDRSEKGDAAAHADSAAHSDLDPDQHEYVHEHEDEHNGDDDEGDSEPRALDKEQREDQSIRGSVY